MIFQIVSLLGAACLLWAYVAAQMGRMRLTSAIYNALNAVGSALLTWVAVHDQRWGFIILEGVWALASLPPLLRAFRERSPTARAR
ncbi:MAG: CBU_0592 family membrane protein [Gemmatimonadaceae bacterium]